VTCSRHSALRKRAGLTGARLGNEGESIECDVDARRRGVVFAATTNRHEGRARRVFNVAVARRLWTGGEPRRFTSDEDDYSAA
jgi:hypothetical protein